MKDGHKRSPPVASCRWISAFSAVLFLTSALGHRFGMIETVPFLYLLAVSGLLALAALALGAVALVQCWEHGLPGAGKAVLGMLVAAIVLVPYGISAIKVATKPRLVDITTDLETPPRFEAALQARQGTMNALTDPSPAEVTLQETFYPEISGRRYDQAAETVHMTILQLIEDRGWKLYRARSEGDFQNGVGIEAVAHTLLLGFASDVVVRIVEEDTATFVDMRSASRYGRHDMGDNAGRIERFLSDLDSRMLSAGGL